MNNPPQLSEQELRNLCDRIIKILLAKNQDYGSASFDLGLNGNMVHLWDKVKRYRTLVEKRIIQQEKPNFEGIEDTLLDIIGYSLIGLVILKHEGDNSYSA